MNEQSQMVIDSLKKESIKQTKVWSEKVKALLDLDRCIRHVIDFCNNGKTVSIPVRDKRQAEICIREINRLSKDIQFTIERPWKVICSKKGS